MSYNTISWLEKYRPTSLSEYYISKKQLDIVKTWIKDFRANNEESLPFLILHGTAGIGKTTLAYLILKYYDYEIIECNASDARTKKHIRDSLGQISKITVCVDDKQEFKQVAIIMDEIDGLAGGESNSVQELIDIVTKDKDSKKAVRLCPVICTTNSIKDKKLQPLIKQGVVLNIGKPTTADCNKLIDKISKNEEFSLDDETRNSIIINAYGDYRQIIMLLFQHYHSLKVDVQSDTTNASTNTPPNTPPSTKAIVQSQLANYNDEEEHFEIIKKISNLCETPLDKINYFLTKKSRLEDICYMCSDDSNLYYMNFYINIIPVIAALQTKSGAKTKDSLLMYYKLLYNIYELLKDADLLNNSIFLDKNWELLDYFDTIGLAIPLQMLHDKNCKSEGKDSSKDTYFIPDYNLVHHTQYNFMRQEQSMIKKKLNVDYMKTYDCDLTNIYYNIKRFKHQNLSAINISNSRSKKKKSLSTIEESKFHIDRTYTKLVEKIDELLS